MNDQTTWAETRQETARKFGTEPHANDDRTIRDAFLEHPAAVIAEINRVAEAHAAGRVHTPWKLLLSKLPAITQDNTQVSLTRDLRVRQAQALIHNTGHLIPNENELRDTLFHATSALLKGLEHELGDHMAQIWHHEQTRTA